MKTVANLALCTLSVLVLWSPQKTSKHETQEVREDLAPVLLGSNLGESLALEVSLWDGTRVDIVTATHAIEVDWTDKWAEGVGQAVYYSIVTGLRPALVLMTKDGMTEKDMRNIHRAQATCSRIGVHLSVWDAGGDKWLK